MKKILNIVIGFAISGIFLYFSCQNIALSKIFSEMRNVHLNWLIVSFFFFLLAIITRAERWRQILLPINRNISTLSSWRIFCLGLAINVILPFRLGDILRGTLAAQSLETPITVLTTSVIIEKICDLIFIFIAGGIALFYIPQNPYIKDFHLGSLIIFSLSIFAVFLLFFAHKFQKIAIYTIKIIFGRIPLLEKKLNNILILLFDSLKRISNLTSMLYILFWSAFSWIFEWVSFISLAFGIPTLERPLASLLTMPVATLSTAIPGAPGAVGTFDFFALECMKLLGNNPEASATYTILIHAIILISPLSLFPIALIYHFKLKKQS